MKRLRGRRVRHKEAAELNITAFMNLMVILVPFLLITAVFSRLAILELDLPGSDAQTAANDEPVFQLEITVRERSIEVGDRNAGLLSRIDNTDDGYDLAGLNGYLREVKQRFPDKANATLLLEQDIPYQVVVEVMDAVRVAQVVNESAREIVQRELFPEISIGDAPVAN
jgi:biopolymer transport protein ExbD